MSMLFSGKCSSGCYYTPETKTEPMPNKYKFKITKIKELDTIPRTVLVVAQYPDATDFNGTKIMIYSAEHLDWIKTTDELDPHFLDNKISPLARFRGDALGMLLAERFNTSPKEK